MYLGFSVVVILLAIISSDQCPISTFQLPPKQKKNVIHLKNRDISICFIRGEKYLLQYLKPAETKLKKPVKSKEINYQRIELSVTLILCQYIQLLPIIPDR